MQRAVLRLLVQIRMPGTTGRATAALQRAVVRIQNVRIQKLANTLQGTVARVQAVVQKVIVPITRQVNTGRTAGTTVQHVLMPIVQVKGQVNTIQGTVVQVQQDVQAQHVPIRQ